jgi:plasmid stability protein
LDSKRLQAMATLTLKNVPDSLYRRLKRSARLHRRSLNGEAIHRLESSLGAERMGTEELLALVRALPTRTSRLVLTDQQLREARDKGRP